MPCASQQFQSTHPARGGTAALTIMRLSFFISIHPPREGWDDRRKEEKRRAYISIHPPREGWDEIAAYQRAYREAFQSTHPARGGTPAAPSAPPARSDFNPPTPRGVGRCPRTGQDVRNDFNPPTPRGVGRQTGNGRFGLYVISIHPPREGWDDATPVTSPFLPLISIHPPREGWDSGRIVFPRHYAHFNPPTPRGVGLHAVFRYAVIHQISIHPPREGWDVFFIVVSSLC